MDSGNTCDNIGLIASDISAKYVVDLFYNVVETLTFKSAL